MQAGSKTGSWFAARMSQQMSVEKDAQLTCNSALLVDARVVLLQIRGLYKLEQRAKSIAAKNIVICFVLASKGNCRSRSVLGTDMVIQSVMQHAEANGRPVSKDEHLGLRGCVVGVYEMRRLYSWREARAYSGVPQTAIVGMSDYWGITKVHVLKQPLPYTHRCGGPYTWAPLPLSVIQECLARVEK